MRLYTCSYLHGNPFGISVGKDAMIFLRFSLMFSNRFFLTLDFCSYLESRRGGTVDSLASYSICLPSASFFPSITNSVLRSTAVSNSEKMQGCSGHAEALTFYPWEDHISNFPPYRTPQMISTLYPPSSPLL